MKDYERLKMLEYPSDCIDIVIDTDAATEIDDPFAIAYALLCPERLNVKAIYAAPFSMNERAKEPAEGMALSYKEIGRILELTDLKGRAAPKVCRGGERYMGPKKEAVMSEAAEDLIKRACGYSSNRPLYIAAMGAGTNIASAIQSCPEIKEKIVIVWLAGDDFDRSPNVYNIYQDKYAAQVIFDCGVPLIHIPCSSTASHLITCVQELEAFIGDKNRLCRYLLEIFKAYGNYHAVWGKQLWDAAVIAYLVSEDYAECEITTSPVITDNLTWSRDYKRHLIKNVKWIDRDKIMGDMLGRIGGM